MGDQMDEAETDPAAEGDEEQNPRHPMMLRRAAQLTGALGAAFAILFLASIWIFNQTPGPSASDQELTEFYASDDKRRVIIVGLYLLPFAAVAFLWFLAALRQWSAASARRASHLLGTVQLLSGISFITLMFAAAGASTVIVVSVEFEDSPVDPTYARQFPIYGDALLLIFGMRMAAIFVMTTTNLLRPAGILPRWFVLTSFLVAAFLFLSASLSFWLVIVFPLWVLALGGLIIYLAYRIPKDVVLPHREMTGGWQPPPVSP
jgi:hypothetical protein